MNPQQLFCEISFAPRTNIPTWTNQSTQEKRQRIKNGWKVLEKIVWSPVLKNLSLSCSRQSNSYPARAPSFTSIQARLRFFSSDRFFVWCGSNWFVSVVRGYGAAGRVVASDTRSAVRIPAWVKNIYTNLKNRFICLCVLKYNSIGPLLHRTTTP